MTAKSIESLAFNLAKLSKFTPVKRYKNLLQKQETIDTLFIAVSDLIMKLTSHLSSQPKSDFSRNFFAPQRSKHSVIDLKSADQEQSAFTITVVVDPASTSAQEIIPVAMVIGYMHKYPGLAVLPTCY